MQKRILSIILAMSLMFSLAAVTSISIYAEEYENFENEWGEYQDFLYSSYRELCADFEYKELDDGTLEVTSYISAEFGSAYIPYAVNGKEVTRIGDGALCFNCQSDLTETPNEVTIPASVTSIGKDAFGYYFSEGGGESSENFGWKKYDDFHIYCYEGTAAEQYAIDNGFDYTILTPNYGNVNYDNKVNILDVLLIRKFIAKQPVVPDLLAADVNCDGSVDMLDVLLIRKYIAKQPVMLGPKPNPPAVESPDVIESPDIIETPEIL